MAKDDPESGGEPPHSKKADWPHAPVHRLGEGGAYIVTAATYQKEGIFAGSERLTGLCDGLLKCAERHGWRLQAWAVFPNHSHFVDLAPESGGAGLVAFLRELHSRSARWANGLDGVAGRKVWHNYWDTHITFEKSYFARLNYVHQNAVKHGVVKVANQYRWCSAASFEREARRSMVKTIYGFKTGSVNVVDDF